MKALWREIRAILGVWWLIVPGGILGVVAIVDTVRSAHQVTPWFWAALAMTALWLATCVRLNHVLDERNRLAGSELPRLSYGEARTRITRLVREADALDERLADASAEEFFDVVFPEVQRWVAEADDTLRRFHFQLMLPWSNAGEPKVGPHVERLDREQVRPWLKARNDVLKEFVNQEGWTR
jgi:hypothetical protein